MSDNTEETKLARDHIRLEPLAQTVPVENITARMDSATVSLLLLTLLRTICIMSSNFCIFSLKQKTRPFMAAYADYMTCMGIRTFLPGHSPGHVFPDIPPDIPPVDPLYCRPT